jgi:hypothetical protein
MKKITAIWLLLLSSISFMVYSQNKPVYANVAFHKIKPGHTLDEALALEKKWKTIHLIRRQAGIISGWSVYSILNGYKTPSIDFDYISVNFSSDLNTITQYPMDKYAALVAKDLSFANIIEETSKVQSIQYNVIAKFVDGTPNSNDLNSIISMEVFKTSIPSYFNYLDFEKQMKNVHQDRVNAGEIQEWSFWQTVAPVAEDSKGQFTAFTFYKDMAHLDAATNVMIDSAKKRMNLTPEQFLKKIDSLRTITQNTLLQYAMGTWNE